MRSTTPAFSDPPHRTDPSGALVIWFTEPPGCVMQFTRPEKGTLAHAEWLVGPVLTELLARYPEPVKARLVMDLRLMTGRDPAARVVLVESTKKYRDRVESISLVAPQTASAVYTAALHASVAVLRAFGVAIAIENAASALKGLRVAK